MLTVLLGTATACGLGEAPTVSCAQTPVEGLAVAVGNRANSPQPLLTFLQQPLESVMDKRKGITVVRVDGAPSVFCGWAFTSSAKASAAKAEERTRFVRFVADALRSVRPVKPEADPLQALSFAAAAARPGGTVVLIDSGLQTVAPLDFRQSSLLYADPTAVVQELARANLLPDLKDRNVILAGIGYTAAPQSPLDEASRKRLVELWRGIALAGGVAPGQLTIIDQPNTQMSLVDDPAVSPVELPPLDNVKLGCGSQSLLSDDGTVGFVPDQADFRDEAAAGKTLTTIAEWLTRNPGAQVRVTGSVAHYGPDDANGLAFKRANRVAAALVGLGVDSQRVVAQGEGWGPFPNKTAPPDLRYDPLNRRVVIEIICA